MMNSTIKHLCTLVVLCAALAGAGTWARPGSDGHDATAPAEVPAAAPASGAASDAVQGAASTPAVAKAEARLAAVRARIAAVTDRVAGELARRDSESARLRESELEVTTKRRALDVLRSAQQAAERRRSELHAEQLRGQHSLDAERAALAAQVRSAYLLGRQEQLKMLLNQNDPAAAARMLGYYGYFARARATKIEEIRSQVQRAQALAADMDRTTARLEELEGETHREMGELERARGARALSVAALTQRVATGNDELARLKRDAQAVESLVADLSRVLQDFPTDSRQSFAQLRGKLAWPVSGKLAARYQASRAGAMQSGARWNGVLIDSARGAKVRAPYYGHVVYADWLQGLGLLIIVGHSGGYMTLYGHAEALYKSVGDAVAPGDAIAVMSDAPGAAPQLYFEIRAGRKTVDPAGWLKANP